MKTTLTQQDKEKIAAALKKAEYTSDEIAEELAKLDSLDEQEAVIFSYLLSEYEPAEAITRFNDSDYLFIPGDDNYELGEYYLNELFPDLIDAADKLEFNKHTGSLACYLDYEMIGRDLQILGFTQIAGGFIATN